MGFKASTNDVHPGGEPDPRRAVWANGPDEGKTLAEAPRRAPKEKPVTSPEALIFDRDTSEQDAVERRWLKLDRSGYLAVQSRKLGLQKEAIDIELSLRELEKEYPAAFPKPITGRPSWFYAAVIGLGLAVVLLQLVQLAHVTRRPTLPEEAEKQASAPAEVASAQGRADAQKGGRR